MTQHEPLPRCGERLASAELVERARAGDREAFGSLYQRYGRLVHGVLLAHAERDDVEDLVQDTFVRAMRQLAGLRDGSTFGGWIRTIAINEARMRRRATRPTEEITDRIPAPSPAHGEEGLDATTVMAAIRRLPDRYREPLVLRLVGEMSGEDIARHTGLSHGSVRVYLHHGMRLLRHALEGERP